MASLWHHDTAQLPITFGTAHLPFQRVIMKGIKAMSASGETFYSYYHKNLAPSGIILSLNTAPDYDSLLSNEPPPPSKDNPMGVLEDAANASICQTLLVAKPTWGRGGNDYEPSKELKRMATSNGTRCSSYTNTFAMFTPYTVKHSHWYMPCERRVQLLEWALRHCDKNMDIDHIPQHVIDMVIMNNTDIHALFQTRIAPRKWLYESGIIDDGSKGPRKITSVKPSWLAARMRVYLSYHTIIKCIKEQKIPPQYVDALVQRFMYMHFNKGTEIKLEAGGGSGDLWKKDVPNKLNKMTTKYSHSLDALTHAVHSLNNQITMDVFTIPDVQHLIGHALRHIMPSLEDAKVSSSSTSLVTRTVTYYNEAKFIKRLASEGNIVALHHIKALEPHQTAPLIYIEIKNATPASVAASLNGSCGGAVIAGTASKKNGVSSTLLAIQSDYWLVHQVRSIIDYMDNTNDSTADSNDEDGTFERYSAIPLLYYLKTNTSNILHWCTYINILRKWAGLRPTSSTAEDGLTLDDRAKLRSLLAATFDVSEASRSPMIPIQSLHFVLAFMPEDGLEFHNETTNRHALTSYLSLLTPFGVTTAEKYISNWRLVVNVLDAALPSRRYDIVRDVISMVILPHQQQTPPSKRTYEPITDQKTNRKGLCVQMEACMAPCGGICDHNTIRFGDVLELSLETGGYGGGSTWPTTGSYSSSSSNRTPTTCISRASWPFGYIQYARQPRRYLYLDEVFINVEKRNSNVSWRINDCLIKWSKSLSTPQPIAPPPAISLPIPPSTVPSLSSHHHHIPSLPPPPSRDNKRATVSSVQKMVENNLKRSRRASSTKTTMTITTETTITPSSPVSSPVSPVPQWDDFIPDF